MRTVWQLNTSEIICHSSMQSLTNNKLTYSVSLVSQFIFVLWMWIYYPSFIESDTVLQMRISGKNIWHILYFNCFNLWGFLKSSWTCLIESWNFVEVQWQSLFRSTSLGKWCTSYNSPPASRKHAAHSWSLWNFLPQSFLFMFGNAQKSHGVRSELNSVFSLEKVDWWNPIRTSVCQYAKHQNIGLSQFWDHKHAHKFCRKYCLHVNSYKHSDGEIFEDILGKINVVRIYIRRNYAQKWITKLYI
jgi:hypothetical protein